jgi:5'(3')-deoxyribonucleotidase
MKFHSLKDIDNKVPKPGSFKHFLRMHENGGRVVKGVNTTADVGVDAIKKQAAKFGNTVDKDGRPPTLSKKVKGSKTNVLFNLGMTESVDNTDESMLYYAKMAENLGEIASTSKVYVDMDGVLADFFGEWQKLIGSDWRKVKDIEPALQKIRDKDNFWLDLPLLPQAKNLLGVIKKVKGSYTILSSPLPNDPNSEPHKREWIKNNLDFFPPENVIITHDKPKYAVNSDGTPNILIDDFGKNIASWEAAGGEGFKHKDHKFERTAKAIKQHMSEPAKEGLGAVAKGAVSNVKNAATAGKLILKYHQTGLEADAFAAIKHGWQWIKNPKMRSKIVDMVKKYAVKHGEDWPTTVAHIKKNTGIDVSNVNEMNEVEERTLTKGEEKKKEKNVKGMKKNKGDFKDRYGKDADAVMYATATKMAKESLLWSIETGKDLNESLDKIIQVLEEMDRRQFMKTAGKVGAGLGAAALYSALPTPVKAMTKDSKPKPKIIMHTSIGREFDLSDRANPAKAILDMYAKIEKIYVDRGETLPQVWVTLDGKQVWAPAGSIPNANKILQTKEKTKKSNDKVAKINKAAQDAWHNGKRLSSEHHMHMKIFRHRYKESIEEARKEKSDEIKGFDSQTMQALVQLKAKYPHAKDPLDALLKSVLDTDKQSDDADNKQNRKLNRLFRTVSKFEPEINDVNRRLANLELLIRKESIDENFADGKKKGKSKPGRVKKSGASCSSSVTELRKKAKNASGERAKMYHWCANMKSGKKK